MMILRPGDIDQIETLETTKISQIGRRRRTRDKCDATRSTLVDIPSTEILF